jgi:hypothetical protein
MNYDANASLAQLSHNLNSAVGDADSTWTGNFPGSFGPTDLLPGPQASGEEILSFWNQYISSPSDIDGLHFG